MRKDKHMTTKAGIVSTNHRKVCGLCAHFHSGANIYNRGECYLDPPVPTSIGVFMRPVVGRSDRACSHHAAIEVVQSAYHDRGEALKDHAPAAVAALKETGRVQVTGIAANTAELGSMRKGRQ